MLFYDQLQRSVHLTHWPPQRIISLVPSQTELLYTLGLDQEVVGITKFCVHPPQWFQGKTRIGGTKTIDFQRINDLQPDLIIGNKEENERTQIEQLANVYPLWLSDVTTLPDALDMILRLGSVNDRALTARNLAGQIRDAFHTLENQESANRPRAAYLIWRKPYMVAAADTFIHDMLTRAGFNNVFDRQTRYPQVSAEELAAAQPAVILLSSEPYPFAQKHVAEIQEICPGARIQLVDGEAFSWYGSRLLSAPGYFQALRKELGYSNP